jgi:hypothetical protein
MLVTGILLVTGCKYKKGDMYTSSLTGDSLIYMILDQGSGESMSLKAAAMKLQHEVKGNSCQVRYISDSAILKNEKGLLLINTSLPNIKDDMLSKGYFGTLTSKQQVMLLLLSDKDFDQHFRKTELEGNQ